jgi:urease gamma subunit
LFLKQKKDGSVKGRAVARGNKQCDYISKEDTSSPTATTESILIISVIAVEENRDTAIVDIPNVFIQTRVEREEDKVIIHVQGYLVDVLCKIWSGYEEYVTMNSRGEKQLLLQCQNAIFGTIIASLLFYNKFCKTLKANDFELNPYKPCVGNRMVNGMQQTCGFHVDDVMLTCVDVSNNDHFIETLREECESVFKDGSGKMTVHRGKVHDYLGMRLDFFSGRSGQSVNV